MSKTYELAHLVVALGGYKPFGQMLESLHELRTDGVFVTPEMFDAEWRLDYGIDAAMLCIAGGNLTAPVLRPAFTERELLQFLTIRSDIAFEFERAYTNDKPKPAPKPDDGTPYPLDERALAEIDGLVPEFAAMLRRLLSKGGKWWVDDAGQLAISESAATQAARKTPETPRAAPAPAEQRTWWVVSSPYIVATLRVGRYTTAKKLYAALEAGVGSPESPFDKGIGANRHSLFVRQIHKSLSLKTIQNNWKKLRTAVQS